MNELLSISQMAQADRLTIAAGTPGAALMERAGRAVADAVARARPVGARVLVACGPGHNGGDGFVAARILAERGYRVDVALLGARDALKGDAALAAAAWRGPVGSLAAADPGGADIVIDALFGAGLTRALVGDAAAFVERLNASDVAVAAVDMPSGIEGDSGRALGPAVTATETVTFFRRKPGHLLLPGRAHCGRVRLADIGVKDSVLPALGVAAWVNGPAFWGHALRAPALAGHKYGRGHAVVVSGAIESTGAARLAARAALRAGAGLVTLASPGGALAVNAAALTAVMVRRVDGAPALAELLADRRHNAVAIGPGRGVGEGARAELRAALASGAGVVADADALTSFAGQARQLGDLVKQAGASVVVTPHQGEFQRLFAGEEAVLGAPSKLEQARAGAALLGASVILKGADTVIAAPDGRALINDNGSPWLATAGSGDVLTGIVAGLLAQGLAPFEAAGAAVWLHGAAASVLGPGLIAEDLSEALPGVLKAYFAERAG